VLEIFQAASPEIGEARTAVERWETFALSGREGAGAAERRFRRRAYERAREEALTAVAMQHTTRPEPDERIVRRSGRRSHSARSRRGRRFDYRSRA
jgi:hypothetical protein